MNTFTFTLTNGGRVVDHQSRTLTTSSPVAYRQDFISRGWDYLFLPRCPNTNDGQTLACPIVDSHKLPG